MSLDNFAADQFYYIHTIVNTSPWRRIISSKEICSVWSACIISHAWIFPLILKLQSFASDADSNVMDCRKRDPW